MIVHGLEDLKKMVEKEEVIVYDECKVCGSELYDDNYCKHCADRENNKIICPQCKNLVYEIEDGKCLDCSVQEKMEEDNPMEENEPTQELEDIESQSPDNREASILTNARNTSLEPSAGDAFISHSPPEELRESCTKIMKLSANTLQKIKSLRTHSTEPLGDVVRRLVDKELNK